jgi:2-methylcitrate dehydratase
MKLSRRKALALAAGSATAWPAAFNLAAADTPPAPLAARLADYALSLNFDMLDPATVEQTKSLIVDALACAVAAFDERPVRACRELALVPADGASTVIGTSRRTTIDLASFANGAAIRYYDLNDAYASPTHGAVHPSDHIGACLAVAEAEKASATETLTAIVLAYEINCRLVDATDAAPRGWDPTLYSLPAVALATGRLMKLPHDQLTQAVALALNDHIPMGQTRTQTNSDWKGLADAEAERNAVFATELARAGVTGPAPIFEGRKGFFEMVASPAEVDVGAFGNGATQKFKILQSGVKVYPAVVYAQTAIVAGIAVAKEVGNMDKVASLEIATTARGYEQAGRDREKWTPQNRDTADHSLAYLTVRAMFDGDITNASYAPDKLRDPKVLALMQKTTVAPDPAFSKPRGNAPATRLTATLTDGTTVTRQIDDMPGFPGLPVDRAGMEHKFRSNTQGRWPAAKTDAILKALWDFEHTKDMRGLLGQMAFG